MINDVQQVTGSLEVPMFFFNQARPLVMSNVITFTARATEILVKSQYKLLSEILYNQPTTYKGTCRICPKTLVHVLLFVVFCHGLALSHFTSLIFGQSQDSIRTTEENPNNVGNIFGEHTIWWCKQKDINQNKRLCTIYKLYCIYYA